MHVSASDEDSVASKGVAAEETIARVGAKIRARRKDIGLTLNELSARTGVSVSMLSMLERGVAGASIGTLVAVATALRLQMYDLFESQAEEVRSPVSPREAQTEDQTAEGGLRRMARHSRIDGLAMVVKETAPGTASVEEAVRHNGRG